MPNHRSILFVLLLALCLATVQAGRDVDFGASVSIDDPTELYLEISSRYFEQDRQDLQRLAARLGDPDDLAVVLFIDRHSNKDVDFILKLQRRGLSWWEIAQKARLRPEVWFVPTDREPSSPYVEIYDDWEEHKRDRGKLVLSDADAQHLVALRMLHEYFDLPVATAMELRADGDNLRWLLADQYEKRHGRGLASSR